MFPPQLFPPALFPNSLFGAGRRLVVNLEGDAAAQLGPVIGVVELAEKVFAFWESHPLT
jgi:hypothetical protein